MCEEIVKEVNNAISSVGDVGTDVAQAANSPLGRMVVNSATGGMSAPVYAAHDIGRGADPGSTIANLGMRYVSSNALGNLFGDSGLNVNGATPGEYSYEGGTAPFDMSGINGLDFSSPDYSSYLGSDTSMPDDYFGGAFGDTSVRGLQGMGEDYNAPAEGGFSPEGSTSVLGEDSKAPAEMGLSRKQPSWIDRAFTGAKDQITGGKGFTPEGIGASFVKGLPAMFATAASMNGARAIAQGQMDRFNTINNQINGMYTPGSAEYNSLWDQMSRADAKAGRNSQYGPRSTDLAAKIAGLKGNMLTSTMGGQNSMYNSSLGNKYLSGLNSMFANYGNR